MTTTDATDDEKQKAEEEQRKADADRKSAQRRVKWTRRFNMSLLVGETALVLLLAVGVTWGAFSFLFGVGSNAEPKSGEDALKLLDQHWKGSLVLLIPLFYRPIRKFLEQTEEAFGMKRRQPNVTANKAKRE